MKESSLNNHEKQIWLDFRNGNHQAFEQLMQFHYKFLFNYGVRITPDKEFIKDCIQDVFLNLWHYRETISAVDSPRFYLLKSLKQKIFKELYKSNSFSKMEELEENYDFEVQFSIENLMIESENDEHKIFQIKHLVGQLSKRQREAIYLRFYQNLDYKQISEIMVINQHSAVNLISDAIKFLRKNWVFSLSLLGILAIK